MENKYQNALEELCSRCYVESEKCTCHARYKGGKCNNNCEHRQALQELVDKETPMKVDKKHYELVDSDAGEYFIISDYYYKCPNPKCKLHKKYELCFEEPRCPECNQLLDWR